jgi:hypothetical protein
MNSLGRDHSRYQERRRRWFTGAVALVVTAAGLVAGHPAAASAADPATVPVGKPAIGTWAAAPVAATPSEANRVNNQTLRQIVHISTGGDQVRVKLSNRYGTAPLTVQAAHVALRDTDEHIVAGSGGQLTFSGQTSFTIPAFGELYSD